MIKIKINFVWNVFIWRILLQTSVDLIDAKQNWSASVRCLVNYVTLIIDVTDELDFGFLRVKVWNKIIQGIAEQIYMAQKECESSIHNHDLNLCVTMVR